MSTKRKTINRKRTVRAPKKVANEDGFIVYEKKEDVALFEMMNNFIFKGGFYWDAEEKLKILESLIDKNLQSDKDYVFALSLFLTVTMGIKLSPVLALTRAVVKSRSDLTLTEDDKHNIRKVAVEIFNRPDKISNALSYAQNYMGLKSFKEMPPFYKRALKEAFEDFKPLTLKKFKLKRREISLSDLIKVLRPCPKNAEMSEVYKNIIENSKAVSLKAVEHITATLSSTELTKEEKKEIIEKSLDKMPINALIRNISQFNDSDEEKLKTIERRISEVLDTESPAAIVNPFDLIFVGETDDASGRWGMRRKSVGESKVNKRLIDMIDKALYTKFIKRYAADDKNVAFLIDVSGSMQNDNIVRAMKFYAMFYPMYKDAKTFFFNSHLVSVPDVVALAKKYKEYPNFLALEASKSLLGNAEIWGSTSLHDSARNVLSQNPETNTLIILTDEVANSDEQDVDFYNKELNKLCSSGSLKVILVNVSPTDKTAFNINQNLFRMSGLDAKIFGFLKMLNNFTAFKKEIKEKFYALIGKTEKKVG